MSKRAFLLCAFLTLCACGGGGGGATTASGGGGAPPVTPAAKIQTVAAQRAVTASTLQGVQTATQALTFNPAGTTPLAVSRAVFAAARKATSGYRIGMSIVPKGVRQTKVVFGPCSNGSQSASNTVSANEVQIYVRTFYDLSCTSLRYDTYLDVVSTSASAGSMTGTVTSYTTSGTVFEYNTLQMSFSALTSASGTFSVQATDATSATSPALAAVGLSCNIASTSLTCGAGGVEHQASVASDLGATLSMSLSATSNGSIVTVPVNETVNAYTASLNALSLTAGIFPNWNVNGGALMDSASVAGQLTFTAGNGLLTGAALTVTDSSDDATVTLAASGTPVQLTGTIKQTSTGQTVATFTVDQNGNGTVTYSNGTVAQISAWKVLG